MLRRLAKQQLPKEKSSQTGESNQLDNDIQMEADDLPMFEPNFGDEGLGEPDSIPPN